MLLDGYVKSKNNTPIAGAKIEIKNNSFATIYWRYTDYIFFLSKVQEMVL